MLITVTLITGEVMNFKVPGNSCIVGRSQKCEVVIPHEGMSRQHIKIEFEKGEFYATDLGSTNGLHIDGQRIPPNQRTIFKSFIPLVFGPVQTLVVKEEVETLTRVKNPIFKLSNAEAPPLSNGQPRMPKLKGPPIPKREVPPPPEEKGELKLIIITLIVALIAAAGWHFYKQMNPKSMGPESIPETLPNVP